MNNATTATVRRIIIDAMEYEKSRGTRTGFVFFGYSNSLKAYYCIWADQKKSMPEHKCIGEHADTVLDFALNLCESEHSNFVHMPNK